MTQPDAAHGPSRPRGPWAPSRSPRASLRTGTPPPPAPGPCACSPGPPGRRAAPASTAPGNPRGRAAGPRRAGCRPPAAPGAPPAGRCSPASSPPCPRTAGHRGSGADVPGHALHGRHPGRGPACPSLRRGGPPPAPLRTSWRPWVELRQRSVAPKQKQRVQPLGLAASREKVPTRHWSHRGPWTFSWGQRSGRAGGQAVCGSPTPPGGSQPSQGVSCCGRGRTRGRWGAGPGAPGTPAPHLAAALACDGVAHSGLRAAVQAVAGAAAGVAVEARGAGVTAAPGHVGSAPARGGGGAAGGRSRLAFPPPGPLTLK